MFVVCKWFFLIIIIIYLFFCVNKYNEEKTNNQWESEQTGQTLTINLQVAFESSSSSGVLCFAFVGSRVLQLDIGNLQDGLGLPQSGLLRDVAVDFPPCDGRNGTEETRVEEFRS